MRLMCLQIITDDVFRHIGLFFLQRIYFLPEKLEKIKRVLGIARLNVPKTAMFRFILFCWLAAEQARTFADQDSVRTGLLQQRISATQRNPSKTGDSQILPVLDLIFPGNGSRQFGVAGGAWNGQPVWWVLKIISRLLSTGTMHYHSLASIAQ